MYVTPEQAILITLGGVAVFGLAMAIIAVIQDSRKHMAKPVR